MSTYFSHTQNNSSKPHPCFAKLERARGLASALPQIHIDMHKLQSWLVPWERQLGTAMFFIVTLGFRAGGLEAKTFGTCSLLVKHLQVGSRYASPNFMGKHSVKYAVVWQLPTRITANLKGFREGKDRDN